MATIVLTGGGTAGHIMPNLSLIPELAKYFSRIVYVGGSGMEAKIVAEYGIDFFQTSTVKFRRDQIFSNLKIPFELSKGIKEAKELFRNIKPDVVFAKGGYVSLPSCFAAKQMGIPYVIHESDFTLGLANKILANSAKVVMSSYDECKFGEFYGNPIRDDIFKGDRKKALSKYKINQSLKTVLIVGGSTGAMPINDATYAAIPKLSENFNIIHIAGSNLNTDIKYPNYNQVKYENSIQDAYSIADVIVSRGGASALSEITALNKKNVIIPLPKGASRGDQEDNASYYQRKNCITVLNQNDLTANTLIESILKATNFTPQIITTQNVNKKIVEKLCSIVKESR